MEIESPYENEVDSFNNIDSFPDLEFVVPGMEHPLLLHKKILAKTSNKIREALMNNPGYRLKWMFETNSDIERQALVKALRFCYGETLRVGTRDDERHAVIVALSSLQVTCLNEVAPQLNQFA